MTCHQSLNCVAVPLLVPETHVGSVNEVAFDGIQPVIVLVGPIDKEQRQSIKLKGDLILVRFNTTHVVAIDIATQRWRSIQSTSGISRLVTNGEEPAVVPEGAVVIAGSRAITNGPGKEWGLSVYTPVIVKYRDAKTDTRIQLEDLLR